MLKAGHHILLVLSILMLVSTSCRKNDNSDVGVTARVGNAALMISEVSAAVPAGLSKADSVRYATGYINRWINRRMISDIASSEIDMTEINRLVEDYRLHLIELEYRRQMFQSHKAGAISEDSLRNYYVEHNEDFRLERPMIKGVYLKVNEDAPNLNAIRRLYRSDKEADIDKLDKEALTAAVHYDYFRDRWVDWEQIELHVPYDFGSDISAFVNNHDYFETSAGGYVYLLDINEVLPTGAVMPFESARNIIEDRLLARARKDYDAGLLMQLYDKSVKDGNIKRY